jgi:hypothetical protein
MRWVHLISFGVFFWSVGLLIVFSSAFIDLGYSFKKDVVTGILSYLITAICVIFLLLSLALLRARPWVRKMLIGSSALYCVCILLLVVTDEVTAHKSIADSFLGVGIVLVLLTPGIMLIMMLQNKDVVADYMAVESRSPTKTVEEETPNQQ